MERQLNPFGPKEGYADITYRVTSDPFSQVYYITDFKWVGDYKPLRGGLQKAGVKSEADWRSRIKEDASGTTVEGATSIDAKIAKELHDRGVPFVDVYIQWFDRRIPGAFFLDMYTFEFNEPRLARIAKKNQEVVIYSSRSSDQADYYKAPATARAVNWGYEKVYYFHGGIDEWEAAGYLVDRESK